MNTAQSVREIIEEWNAKAKAEGKYLDRDPGSIPPAAGSLLDVPETAASRARIAWLQQQIADLQQQCAKADLPESAGGGTQDVQALRLAEPTTEKQPSAAGPV